jgi:hypothetical protein
MGPPVNGGIMKKCYHCGRNLVLAGMKKSTLFPDKWICRDIEACEKRVNGW